MFGSQSTTPAFGTGLGLGLFGAQRGGSRLAGYAPEPENSSIGTGGAVEKLESISAMPVYKDKSHEELRWEDYHLGDKGGPTFAAQSSEINFSWSTSQPSIFSASSTFSQSSSSLFSTSSSLFAPKASSFSFTGFGPSTSPSPDLFITTTSATSVFGPTASPSTSNSSPSFGPSRFTTQVPGSAPSFATARSFSFNTSPIFAKPDVSSSPFRTHKAREQNKMETTAIGATASFCKNIYTILGKDHHDHNMDVQVSIFRVPKSLSASKPEVYVPQLVGLGPYHHFRSELQQMQTYKLAELKKLRKGFRDISFKKLVYVLKKLVMQRIRASYETYLDMDDESLACIIAIDGLFLFELLCCYGISRGDLFQSEFLCELVKSAGRRMARDTTLRDAMVLENQIPIFVLKVILIIELFSEKQGEPLVNNVVRELLPLMLLGFCKAVSPLAVLSDYPLYKALKHFHLVDLLYHLVTLDASPEKNSEEEEDEARFIQEMSEEVKKEIRPAVSSIVGQVRKQPSFGAPFGSLGASKSAFSAAAPFSFSDVVPQELEKPVKLFEGLLKLPWAQLRSNILSAVNESPNVEEILIPKASELQKGGIKFCPADRITQIRFELNTLSFHLPLIKVDVNSEVILKNLVAYEAMIKSESEPLILTRYMELMGGLIESSDDVMVLKGVIHSESLKDDDVAKLFSGMSKSMRATKTPDLEKQIAAVNDFYNDLWKVSASKFTKKWWRTTWSFCKVLAAFLVLLLMAIQAFCSVYECHRLSFRGDSPMVQQGFQVIPFRSNI